MSNVLHRRAAALAERDLLIIDEHFNYYTDGDLWTFDDSDDNCTISHSGGSSAGNPFMQIALTTDDNEEGGIFTTNEIFKFLAGKPFTAYTELTFTDQASNAGNVGWGFADAAGADFLQDDGAGDNINDTGVVMFKVDGEAVWRVASRVNAGTVTETQAQQAADGGSNQKCEIIGSPVDGSIDEYEFTFKVDNVYLTDSNNKIIKHKHSYTTVTDMDFCCGYAKSGAAANLTLEIRRPVVVWQR